MTTSPLKLALLNADGKVVTVGGERRKLICHEVGGCFFCNAQILNPKTDEDAQYCLMDVWNSDSDKAMRFLAKFAALGGYMGERETQVEVVANGCVFKVPAHMVGEVRAHEQERARRELERNDGD